MSKYGIISESTGTWLNLLSERTKPLLYETREEAEQAALSLNVTKYKIALYEATSQ